MARIRANTNLTDIQRSIELKRTELQQLQASAVALGEQLPPEPEPPPSPPKTPPGTPHVLGPGETLRSVATLFGISPEQLRAANPNLNMDKLRPGTAVNIPFMLPPGQLEQLEQPR